MFVESLAYEGNAFQARTPKYSIECLEVDLSNLGTTYIFEYLVLYACLSAWDIKLLTVCHHCYYGLYYTYTQEFAF